MAFLWKHPNSKYWQARFYDRDGRRRNRSTRIQATERNRRKAQRIAEEFEEAANNRRSANQVRKVITELHQELTGDSLKSVTVRDHVNQWIARKEKEVKSPTLTFYKGATNKFTAFLGSKASRDIAEITRDDITRFRDHEANRVAAKTANHAVKCIRMLFKDALRDALIAEDPTVYVETVRKDRGSEPRPFTTDELQVVLEAANEEWRSMVLFGLYTGQRLGDIASLTWDNIDLARKEVRLVTSKTGRQQTIPMAGPLHRHVMTLSAGDQLSEPVHPAAYLIVEKQGKTGHLSNQFADLLAQVGLRKKVSHRSKEKGRSARRDRNQLTFHSLRHTATTLMHEAGVAPAVVQQIIGHDSSDVHQGYISTGRESAEKAVSTLPNLL